MGTMTQNDQTLGTAELKRLLKAEGFEIYRTLGAFVVLAERVRANLIMDSGVAAASQNGLALRVVVRGQMSHFPGASGDSLLGHVGTLASVFEGRGYAAEEPRKTEMLDPSDPSHVLDVGYEIALGRSVGSVGELIEELRLALLERRTTADE